MNIRKNIDYSEMYIHLDMLMAMELPQMDCTARSTRSCARERKRVPQLWHLNI